MLIAGGHCCVGLPVSAGGTRQQVCSPAARDRQCPGNYIALT